MSNTKNTAPDIYKLGMALSSDENHHVAALGSSLMNDSTTLKSLLRLAEKANVSVDISINTKSELAQ